jgi:hypothetical protein
VKRATWKKKYSANKTLKLLKDKYGGHFEYEMATDDAGLHLVIVCHESNAKQLRERVPLKYEGFRVIIQHGNEERREQEIKEQLEYEADCDYESV